MFSFFFYGCQEELEQLEEEQEALTEEGSSSTELEGELILGDKLENPYSVANMQKALTALNQTSKSYTGKTLSMSEIEATHYYIKVLIENQEQLEAFETDSINLSEIPMDVEIEQEGSYYEGEFLTEKKEKQWFYTAIPVDYQLPSDLTYEKLEDLFLQEEEDEEDQALTASTGRSASSAISSDFLNDLEEEALKLTDNYEELEDEGVSSERRKRKRPKGTITVYNTETGKNDPVVGIKVKTRRWFKWGHGWTNSDGKYSINRKYRRSVHYTIVFKNTIGFKVRNDLLAISAGRFHPGKHSRSGYSVRFIHSKGWRMATVNNATVKYFNYCSQLGITKPHSNLRIQTNKKKSDKGSSAGMLRRTWRLVGFYTRSSLKGYLKSIGINLVTNGILTSKLRYFLPDLIIKTGDNAYSSKKTFGVYKSTFHELAHASHYRKVGNAYWIKYINYIIDYGAYGDGTGENAGVCGVGELWGYYLQYELLRREFPGKTEDKYYNKNKDWFNPGFLKEVADISDVSISEIFSCLTYDTDTLEKLIAKLKTKTIYDHKIDEAYNTYTDWGLNF